MNGAPLISGALELRCWAAVGLVFRFGDGVVVPYEFEGFGEGLLFYCSVDVAGVAGEEELVVVAAGGEDFGHQLVRGDPVVHVVAHGVGVEEVRVTYLHPEADGLGRGAHDEVLGELVGAVGCGGIVGPLLVDVGAGVGEDAVVEVGVIPGHDEGDRASGAAAHGGAGVRVVGEFDVGVGLDEGEDFLFHKFRVLGR